jgi:hypothetical protein
MIPSPDDAKGNSQALLEMKKGPEDRPLINAMGRERTVASWGSGLTLFTNRCLI